MHEQQEENGDLEKHKCQYTCTVMSNVKILYIGHCHPCMYGHLKYSLQSL